MRNFRTRFLFLSFVLLLICHLSLQAQCTIGVKWDAPKDHESAISQLEKFHDLGISILEVRTKLSPEIWQKINDLQFKVYGSLNIEFPLPSTFETPDSTLIQNIQSKASVYLSQPSVSAIGLFEYGATNAPAFFDALQPIASQLKQSGQHKLYYVSQTSIQDTSISNFVLFDIRVTPANWDTLSAPLNDRIDGYFYNPSDEVSSYLRPFDTFLKATSSLDKAIFLPSGWLLKILDENPQFANTLRTLSSQPDMIFPLPKETIPSPKSLVLPILILLATWGTIGWHYNLSPLYRKSLFRYFFGHKFFINDIFQRQIRSVLPALTIILQNALLVSASCSATFAALFSPLGIDSFFYHFPSLALLGATPFSIFVWVFLFSLLISFTSIIWLTITHRSISSLTQITTIYAWPLQLNFIFCTIGITIFSAGGSHYIVTLLTVIAVLIFLLSFIFTSADTLRFTRSRLLHLVKTIIPYLVVLTGGLIWLLSRKEWIEALNLSLYLK